MQSLSIAYTDPSNGDKVKRKSLAPVYNSKEDTCFWNTRRSKANK